MPEAIAIGIDHVTFWSLTPRLLKVYVQAHQKKLEEQDYMNWMLGQYFCSAISTSLEHGFNKHAKSKYVEKPFMYQFNVSQEDKDKQELDKLIQQEMAWIERDKKKFTQGQ